MRTCSVFFMSVIDLRASASERREQGYLIEAGMSRVARKQKERKRGEWKIKPQIKENPPKGGFLNDGAEGET